MVDALNGLDTITTFAAGYNPANSVYIFDKQTYWQVQRSVRQSTILSINKDSGYNITLIQDGTTLKMQNSETATNTIFIKQRVN